MRSLGEHSRRKFISIRSNYVLPKTQTGLFYQYDTLAKANIINAIETFFLSNEMLCRKILYHLPFNTTLDLLANLAIASGF